MDTNFNSVGRTELPGEQWVCGVGYVALPSDVEREVYVKECLWNHYISLWTENSGFLNKIPIDEDSLNFVDFPQTYKELGTPFFYVVEPIHKQPVIVARLSKSGSLGTLKEGQFRFSKKIGKQFVEVSGSAVNNYLNLIVNSGSKSGKINIQLLADNSDGELNVDIDGAVNIIVNGKTIASSKEFDLIAVDDNGEQQSSWSQSQGVHKISGEKILFNEGSEPTVLGSELKSQLSSLISIIASATVMVNGAPTPLLNAPAIKACSDKLESFLSKEVFLNK